MLEQWYSMSGEEVARAFRSNTLKGLTEKEVKERLKHFGPNQLVKTSKMPLWGLFLAQFQDFMVVLLLIATAISGLIGEYIDALAIIVIVILNAILGCLHEYRAERSMEALKELVSPEARVIREGLERKISADQLVPGDIILLETGDRVQADVRLLQVSNLEIEESALTGESVPVRKSIEPIPPGAGPGDIRNMAFMGTAVTRGHGRGIVVATGMATEMGHIAGMIQEVKQEETPLQRRLGQLGKVLVAFCLAVCALVVVLGVYRGEPLYHMFLTGISLAVAVIPEGLPAIVTIALAVGVQRMARRKAIVRKLSAVETLGCATVICSDKTGTLTQNEMTVRRVLVGNKKSEVTGEGYDPKGAFTAINPDEHLQLFLKIAALCNNAVLTRGPISIGGMFRELLPGRQTPPWGIHGDPTEGALLVMAAKGGVWREEVERKEQRVVEFPFDPERKRMTVVYRQTSGSLIAYTKGAPDIILDLCTHYYDGGQVTVLTPEKKEEILRYNATLATEALRVLAMAYRSLPPFCELEEDNVEKGLVFVGLAGMIDPPRQAVPSAIQRCRRAGIKVVMITGDQRLTASAIARELGLLARPNQILDGTELDKMSDRELQLAAREVSVYARVSPRHKLRIVRALKKDNQVVAMTGDGVNDAPAVKEADIGIAMGIVGTDVTKEAAAMVLADDNFNTIVSAIEEGRGIYDNIRKSIRYLLSCNVGEVLVMFLAVLAGMPLPLLPIQILWMNLVTDGLPAIALGMDPADRDIMRRRPRNPRESIFAHGLGWRILSGGILISLGTVFVFGMAYQGDSCNLEESRTMAFNTLVFFQLFYVLTCRSEHHNIIEPGIFTNPQLLLAIASSVVLQLAVNYLPFLQPLFHTVFLNGWQWAMILLVSVSPFFFNLLYHYLQSYIRKKTMYLKV